MKKIYILLTFLCLLIMCSPLMASQYFEGAISGDFIVNVETSYNQVNVHGGVSGGWFANMEDNGSLSAEVYGTFGGLNNTMGVSGNFNLSYDPITNTLTGNWTLPDESLPVSIEFNFDPQRHEFVSPISGIIPSEDGGYPFNGEIRIKIQAEPTEIYGSIQGQIEHIVVEWAVLELGVSGQIEDRDGTISGGWDAKLLDNGDITGTASGEFSGSIGISLDISKFINLPLGLSLSSLGIPTTISIEFPYKGTWQGNIGGEIPSTITFKGCWIENLRNGHGTEALSASNIPDNIHIPNGTQNPILGGGFDLNVNLSNGNNFPYPFTGSYSGGGSFVFDISDKISSFLSVIPSQYRQYLDNIPTSITIEWKVNECRIKGEIDVNPN